MSEAESKRAIEQVVRETAQAPTAITMRGSGMASTVRRTAVSSEVEGDIATAGVQTLRKHRVGWRRV